VSLIQHFSSSTQEVTLRTALILLFTLWSVSPVWAEGGWKLSDTRFEVVKDTSNTPGKWIGGQDSVAIQKSWYNANAGRSFAIGASFGWTGIPLTLASGQDYTVSVSIDQTGNNETGYDPWIKIYAGEQGGVEADGPAASVSWRRPISRDEANGILRAPSAKAGSAYVVRVLCKVAGDHYIVHYIYLPSSAEGSIANPTPLSGLWSGTWSNTLGESGPDSLSLSEDASGNLSGIWSGSIEVSGRRLAGGQIELQGQTVNRAFTIRGALEGGGLVLRYTAQRLDSSGSYSGQSRFQRN
jgi:hypothetical protein